MSPSSSTPDSAPLISIDPEIEFLHREVGSRTQVIAHHVGTGKFFQLGAEEYRIASLLDGKRSIVAIVEQLHQDGVQWEPADVAELIKRFVSSGVAIMATGPAAKSGSSPTATPAPSFWKRNLPQSLSMVISQRIPLMHGDRLAAWLEKRMGVFFSGNGIAVWCVLVATGLLVVWGHRREFGEEVRRMFDPGMWLVLLVLWVVAKVIHELGHAVAARYHGVRVGKIGIMFFMLAPLAYVDVTDAWKLRSRWSRVQIALGGVYFELACAAVAALAWWFLPPGLIKHIAAQFFLVAGPTTLLVNANPLLRLDGYYVVADLAEIPNLRMHGRNHCIAAIEKLLVNIPSPRPLLSGWRRPFATVHAIFSVIFQVVWMSGLVFGVSMWAKGLGISLAIVAVTLWAVLPLSKWVFKVWMYPSSKRGLFTVQRYRLAMIALMVATTVPSITFMESPFHRRVPVVVQFREEQIARAATEAFVKRVHVFPGQRVDAGMLLVELSNPELQIRRNQKADDLKMAQLKAIQLRRQDSLSKSAGELENAESLGRQLAELDAQIASMTIFSVREGFVVGRRIDSLQGSFVRQGEELFRVCHPQEKELLASVGPSDVEAYQAAATRGALSQIRLRGGLSFSAKPASLRPRARVTPPHPALAATVGGPLPVEPSPDGGQEWRTIDPQMESITPIDAVTSLEINAGQIGTMTIDDNRSFFARLIETMKR